MKSYFICEKNYHCCNYEYADRKEDLEKEALECGHLIEVAPVNHCKLIREKIGNSRMTVCTNCQTADGQFYPNGCMHYCPYCGAIVDSMELE